MDLRRNLSGLFAAGVLAAVPAMTTAPAEAAAPDPVVIIPGLFGSGSGPAQVGYAYLANRLTQAGHSASIFVTPDYGVGDIHANAALLADLVDDVLADSGATKVDLVGHSQGGIIARDYVKNLGGSAKVDSLVMYGTPNYGAQNANLATQYGFSCLGWLGCQQIAVGSPFLNALNAGDDSIGSVRYTSLVTEYDNVMTPYTNAFLNAADGNISNVNIQDQCPYRYSEHTSVLYDGTVIDGVVDALKGGPVQLSWYAF